MTVTRRTAVTDELILGVLMAENTAEVAAALTAALKGAAHPELVDTEPEVKASNTSGEDSPKAAASAADADRKTRKEASAAAEVPEAIDDEPASSAADGAQSHRGAKRAVSGDAPAALLHTDGLWLADGTCVELATPIVHVGQVAELAYAHNLGYPLSAKYSEPGQIWSARLVRLCCKSFRREETSVERRCISGSSMNPPW